jgi:hypothetical protein
MVVQMNDRDSKRFAWFVLVALLIVTADVVFGAGVVIDMRRYCDNASNTEWILRGCWAF